MLTQAHVKLRLQGHWGATPGLNFIYLHLNRIIRECNVGVLFVAGPGHGAPGVVAGTWMEATDSEVCAAGIGIWEWASSNQGGEPDVVMACAGDVPTLECLAAVNLLRRGFPALRVRVVNVVDLITLQFRTAHPHGLAEADFDIIFTAGKPVIFVFHTATPR